MIWVPSKTENRIEENRIVLPNSIHYFIRKEINYINSREKVKKKKN